MSHRQEKTAPIYEENRGEVLRSTWEKCTPSNERGHARNAGAFLLLFLGALGVLCSSCSPAASLLLCSGWLSWRPHPCPVPKCHRGSCLAGNLDFLPHVLSLPLPLNTIGSCGQYVTSATWCLHVAKQSHAGCHASSVWQGPAGEQHSSMGRRVLFQTMISLTGWSGTKVAPCRSSAETVSSHLYIMAWSHASFVWPPCLYLTQLPRLSGETLPRAGYSTLSCMLSWILGND